MTPHNTNQLWSHVILKYLLLSSKILADNKDQKEFFKFDHPGINNYLELKGVKNTKAIMIEIIRCRSLLENILSTSTEYCIPNIW